VTSSGPLFRLAQEADADLILEFMREYYAFDGHHFDEQNSPAALMGLLRDGSLGRIWLIQDGDAAPVANRILCGWIPNYASRSNGRASRAPESCATFKKARSRPACSRSPQATPGWTSGT
jgi:hypothetical protein